MHATINAIAALLVQHNCYSTYFMYDEAVLEVLQQFINTQYAHTLAQQYTQLLNTHTELADDVASAMYELHGDVSNMHDACIYDTFTA